MLPFQELRIALRRLRRRPGENLLAVLALALGIGLTTGLFGVVHGSFLRQVPLPEPDRLMGFEYGAPRGETPGDWVPFPVYRAWRERLTSFEDLAMFLPVSGNLSGAGGPAERRKIAFVSANFFDLARVQPRLGRAFSPQEETAGAPSVAILSHALWHSRYGGDPEIVGRTVRVYGDSTTVVGVMPEGFHFPWAQDVWMPLGAWPGVPLEELGVFTFARLAEGVPLARAREELALVDGRLQSELGEIVQGRVGHVASYRDVWFDRDERRAHLLLLLVVAAMLLLACVNVASLLLSRMADEGRALAVRTALGAGRGRVVALPMLEAALLTFAGGLGGLGLARIALELYARWAGNRTGAYWATVELSGPVFLFGLGVIAVTALVTGALPAVRSADSRWLEQLRGSAGARLDRSTGRWQRLLVGTQIALGAALLVVTALVVQSLMHLDTATTRDSDKVLTARVTLYGADPPAPEIRRAGWRELESRLQALPGVQHVSLSSGLPGSGVRESRAARAVSPETPFPVRHVTTTAPLFRVLGAPVLRGADPDVFDRAEGEPVAWVSRTLAERRFPGRDPLDEHLVLDPGEEWEQRVRIVGLVGDLVMGRPDGQDRSVVYTPWSDRAPGTSAWVALRAIGDPLSLAGPLTGLVTELAPDQPVDSLRTLDGALAEASFSYRFSGGLLLVFGAVALLLAAVGLYAVMSFQVRRRNHEMGVRLAVGARRGDLMSLVLRGGLVQVAFGLVPGLVLGMFLARAVTAFLYRVEGATLPVLAAVASTLLATGLAACWRPARRAARTDPIAELRAE